MLDAEERMAGEVTPTEVIPAHLPPTILIGDWEQLGEAAAAVRTAVFVQEQQIPSEQELDSKDAKGLHCVAFIADLPVATGRLLPSGSIGRMAVLSEQRGQGYGRVVLQALIEAAQARGHRELMLQAQAAAVGFYARQGFEAEGDTFEEDGRLHLRMRLRFERDSIEGSLAGVGPQESNPSTGMIYGSGAAAAGGSFGTTVTDPPADEPALASGASERVLVRMTERHETMSGGISVHLQEWRSEQGDGPSLAGEHGGIYLLHGLGEHIGRYDALARWLCARGWRVRGHDHAGHGRSGGRRGVLAFETEFIDHARTQIEQFSNELGQTPILLGHSMGGALAAHLVLAERLPVRGLVLSSPALDPGLRPLQRALAAIMYRIAPDLSLGNGLDPNGLSHDAGVVRAYLEDPLVHDRITARLVHWLVAAGAEARARAASLAQPTLMLVAGADTLVAPEASRRFARQAPAGLLTLHWYENLYHELFNELDPGRRTVLSDLDRWLSQQTQSMPN